MKRLLIVFLAVLLVASIGCSKKQEEQKAKTKTEVGRIKGGSLVDPVDRQDNDFDNSNYSYVYKEIEYRFNSKDNMEVFMNDPEKYLTKE